MSETAKKDLYKAALIVIGNEILSGRTQDTNTTWIGEHLTTHGIQLAEVRVVPDEENIIVHSINDMRKKYDYLFTTGGIGPTHDDITAAAVARALNLPLVRHAEALEMLERHYGSASELTPPRLKMAMVPQGARLIPNPVTAAPGFIVENVHVMAGVPRIMQAMFDHILDLIATGKPIISYTVTCGLPESILAQPLEDLQKKFPEIQIGSYPYYRSGSSGLSLVLKGTEKEMIETAGQDLIRMIRELGGEPKALSIYASGQDRS